MITIFFSKSFDTLEKAQAACGELGIFPTLGAFRTPEGKYVTGNLRIRQWSDEELTAVATNVKQLCGYELVAYTLPIVMRWEPWEAK